MSTNKTRAKKEKKKETKSLIEMSKNKECQNNMPNNMPKMSK